MKLKPEHREILRQIDGLLASATEHQLMVKMEETARVKRLPPKLRKYERRINYVLLAKNVVLARKIRERLQRAYPHASKQTLGSVAVGLADLWRVSETHRQDIRELAGAADRKRLNQILEIVGYQHAPEAEAHNRELRQSIPRLLRSDVRKKRKRAGRRK